MRLSSKLTILSMLLFVAACHNPASDTSRAVTSEPARQASPQSAAGGQKYVITPQNSKIEFVVNLQTAKALGLTIAPEVLYQANRLIR